MQPVLDSIRRLWEGNGFRMEIKDAPNGAVTFDKMLIVFNESNKIRSLYFYSSKEDKILGCF